MWWLSVLLSAVACALVHASLTRLAKQQNVVMLFIVGAGLVGSALLIWCVRMYGAFSLETVSAVITYGAYCELYLFLFTLALSSVSANILVRLEVGPRTVKDIDLLYDNREMVRQRLARMTRSGLLKSENDRLCLTSKGFVVVQSYRALRRIFRHIEFLRT